MIIEITEDLIKDIKKCKKLFSIFDCDQKFEMFQEMLKYDNILTKNHVDMFRQCDNNHRLIDDAMKHQAYNFVEILVDNGFIPTDNIYTMMSKFTNIDLFKRFIQISLNSCSEKKDSNSDSTKIIEIMEKMMNSHCNIILIIVLYNMFPSAQSYFETYLKKFRFYYQCPP